MQYSDEEKRLIDAYRSIESAWERRAIFLLVHSLGWGNFGSDTDRLPYERLFLYPKERERASPD